MRTIPAASVVIEPDRQRKFFDEEALSALATDIQTNGLLHAIALRADGKTLVAGERRHRAICTYLIPLGRDFEHDGQPVPSGHIPYTLLSDRDALSLVEAEFAENARREDLSWQEKADATARLHRLRQAQAEAYSRVIVESGSSVEPPVQTIADTAQEIHGRSDGSYHQDVRQDIILAKHLDNPLIAKAKTAKEAMKILIKDEERQRHSVLAAAVGRTYSATTHQAIQGDCLDWMSACPAGTFDVILTDPPYGMGAHEFGDAAGKLTGTEHHYDDSHESFTKLMRAESSTDGCWCEYAYKVAKPQAHAYVFCDFDRFHELKGYMEKAGWYVFRTPLINVKESGRVPLPEQGPRRQYEICLYAIKGGKHTTGIFSDVIHSTADEQMGHGAQKPVSLYIDLLRRSVRPGDVVLDSFSGSGTIFAAATEMKCRAVGVEMNQASYGMGIARLQAIIAAETAQGELLP